MDPLGRPLLRELDLLADGVELDPERLIARAVDTYVHERGAGRFASYRRMLAERIQALAAAGHAEAVERAIAACADPAKAAALLVPTPEQHDAREPGPPELAATLNGLWDVELAERVLRLESDDPLGFSRWALAPTAGDGRLAAPLRDEAWPDTLRSADERLRVALGCSILRARSVPAHLDAGLCTLLADRSGYVRRALTGSVSRLPERSDEVREAVHRALGDPLDSVRAAALEAHREHWPGDDVAAEIVALADDPGEPWPVRREALATAISWYGFDWYTPERLELATVVLRDPGADPILRSGLAFDVQHVPGAEDRLWAALDDPVAGEHAFDALWLALVQSGL